MLIIMNVRGESKIFMEEGKKDKREGRKKEFEEEQELNLILNLKWVGFVKLDQIQLRRRLSFFLSLRRLTNPATIFSLPQSSSCYVFYGRIFNSYI